MQCRLLQCLLFFSLEKRPNKRHSTHIFKCKGSNFLSTACSTLPIAISFKLRPRRINFSHRFIEFPDLTCRKYRKLRKYKGNVSKQSMEYHHFVLQLYVFSSFFFIPSCYFIHIWYFTSIKCTLHICITAWWMCFHLTSLLELAIFSIWISCSSIWCCVICFAYKYELKCLGFESIFCRILGAYYEEIGTIYLHRIVLHHSDLLFVATVCGDCWS